MFPTDSSKVGPLDRIGHSHEKINKAQMDKRFTASTDNPYALTRRYARAQAIGQ
jgi:hypothetical protein